MNVAPSRRWSTSELCEVVADAVIVGRDRDARPARLPRALTEVGRPDARPWEEQLRDEFVGDRGIAIEHWWLALEQPGELVTTQVRRRYPDSWAEISLSFLNLLHQDDVGCVLVVVRRLRDIDPPVTADATDGAAYSSPASIVQHLDELGTILRTEGQVEEIFGRGPAEILGEPVSAYLHPDDVDAGVAMWLEVLGAPGTTRTIEQRIVRPDGSATWILSTVMNRLDESSSILSVSHDITANREQRTDLRAAAQELRFLAEEAPVAVFRADADGHIVFTNTRWDHLIGPVESVVELHDRIHPDDRAILDEAVLKALYGLTTTEAQVRTADRDLHLGFRLRGVGDQDERHTPIGVIGTADDVTATAEITASLRRASERDPLTELANRRGLTRALDTAVAQGRSTVVLFGDLDDFKQVNDDHGHEAGDALLMTIGSRLREAVRPGDVAGRWGGDEFVVVCTDVPEGGEHELREQLREALARPVDLGGGWYEPTMSLGVVRPDPGDNAEDVLRRADSAMYEAKRRRHRG